MHRKLLLCLAFVGIALSACVGGRRNGRLQTGEECDPPASQTDSSCCDNNCMFKPNTVICAAGETCFAETKCTGHDSTCNKVAHFLPNAVCELETDCNYAAKCDPGPKDGSCLTPEHKPTTTLCFDGVTAECTVDTYCDGQNPDCPNPYAPSTLVCDTHTGPCENDAHCPGVDADISEQYACPAKTFKQSTDADGQCDAGDSSVCTAPAFCDGSNAACPSNPPSDAGTPCGGDTYNEQTCHDQSVCRGGAATNPDSYTCDPVALDDSVMCDATTVNDATCTGESYCAGGGSFDCNARAADAGTVCDPSTDDASCYAGSVCAGSGDFTCVPQAAESSVVCDSTPDAASCIDISYCAGGTSFDCVPTAADDTVMCDASSVDDTTCTGESYCAGGGSFDCNPRAADAGVVCDSSTDDAACYAGSLCAGAGSFECVPQAASSSVVCDSSTDDASCYAGSLCAGGGSFDCIPQAAGSDIMCDASTQNDAACVGVSYCAGGDSFDCIATDADAGVMCNAATYDPTTCTTESYCSGDSTRSCDAHAALGSVECRSSDSCNYAQNCDGSNTGCPAAVNYPDDQTDCSDTCGADETATCDGSGTCGNCEHEGVINDPYVVGFHGKKFWFEGNAGDNYNFFSQPGLQINVLIAKANVEKKMTVVSTASFITASNKVSFDPINGARGHITINGKNVTFDAKKNSMDINDCVQVAWSNKSVMFSSAEFEIVFAFKAANPKEKIIVPYMNIKLVHVSGDVAKMSGVIGATAVKDAVRITNHEALVSNIFATDDAKSTYTGAALSCKAGAKSDNKMGAATKHQLDELDWMTWESA